MPLRHTLWIVLAILLAACNLAEPAEEETLQTPIAVAITRQPTVSANDAENITGENEEAEETEETEITSNNEPASIPAAADPIVVVPVNTGNTTSSNASTCTPRTDLPTYTVVSGDTLYSIATSYNSTVADLSAYNCLADNNVISVGQRLYVPTTTSTNTTSNTTASSSSSSTTSNTNTNSTASTNTTGEPIPAITNYNSFDGTTYTVNEGEGLQLTLPTEGLDDRLTQIEFVYTDDRTEFTSVWMGTDNNFSDGISIFWTPDSDLQGTIVASGRIPGQMHEVFSSAPIRVESESLLVGPLGGMTISPNEQAGSATNGSTAHVLTGGETVTVTWGNIDASYTNGVTVTNVNFFYYPATGGITPIGTDNNINDGISITWEVPANVYGGLAASATVLNANTLISPRVQVSAGDIDVRPCEFVAYGIGGPVPVYGIPNTATDMIRTMTASETAPVLGTGGTWTTEFGGSGTFYHVDFGSITGWVQDGRGGLQGDCDESIE